MCALSVVSYEGQPLSPYPEARDFISLCFKSGKELPYAIQLLEHPFIADISASLHDFLHSHSSPPRGPPLALSQVPSTPPQILLWGEIPMRDLTLTTPIRHLAYSPPQPLHRRSGGALDPSTTDSEKTEASSPALQHRDSQETQRPNYYSRYKADFEEVRRRWSWT